MSGLRATCACGAVTVVVPRKPDSITDCNCSLCTKLGATWAYYAPDEVEVDESGLDSFTRPDMPDPWIRNYRCATCGCVTHWRLIRPIDEPKSGVNANLFEPDEIEGIEIRHVDERSWPLE